MSCDKKNKKKEYQKNNNGRPTKYEERFCQEIIEFFDIPHTYEKKHIKYTEKHGEIIYYTEEPNPLPTFEKFAVKIGVHRETLLNWCENHEDFFDAYKKAKDFQKDMIIDLGIRGFYAQPFTIFTAKNITDMHDTIKNENLYPNGIPSRKIVFDKDVAKKVLDSIKKESE